MDSRPESPEFNIGIICENTDNKSWLHQVKCKHGETTFPKDQL